VILKLLAGIGIVVIALLVLGSMVGTPATSPGVTTGSATPTLAVSAGPTTAARSAVTVKGTGISKSKPFHLAGNYAVTWTAQSSSSVGCYHGADLQRADGTTMFETLVNESISDAKPHTGATNLYNLDDAQYYVDASSGCAWSFTFTPA
jgi:hypothetical protein